MTISIITAGYRITQATDLGVIRAALSIAKGTNVNELTYTIQDQPNRTASVVKWNRWDGRIVEIKKPC